METAVTAIENVFQFTPLREGRRCFFPLQPFFHLISIHAPPRGATFWNLAIAVSKSISIHAPPRGATPPLRCQVRLPAISIHAPPRGATRLYVAKFGCQLFQFTPLREGRPSGRTQEGITRYFNSRPSARGDLSPRTRSALCECISIHAPPRGATSFPPTQALRTRYFNSRPSARGDMYGYLGTISVYEFQFTPLREGRRKVFPAVLRCINFNSRPSARGDAYTSCDTSRY